MGLAGSFAMLTRCLPQFTPSLGSLTTNQQRQQDTSAAVSYAIRSMLAYRRYPHPGVSGPFPVSSYGFGRFLFFCAEKMFVQPSLQSPVSSKICSFVLYGKVSKILILFFSPSNRRSRGQRQQSFQAKLTNDDGSRDTSSTGTTRTSFGTVGGVWGTMSWKSVLC